MKNIIFFSFIQKDLEVVFGPQKLHHALFSSDFLWIGCSKSIFQSTSYSTNRNYLWIIEIIQNFKILDHFFSFCRLLLSTLFSPSSTRIENCGAHELGIKSHLIFFVWRYTSYNGSFFFLTLYNLYLNHCLERLEFNICILNKFKER